MAVFSFLIGSIVGLMSTILGWTAFDMSFLAGIGLYLTSSVSVGVVLILANMAVDNGAETARA